MTLEAHPAVNANEIGDTPRVRTVTGLLADGAARTPEAELLRFGDESWTYRRFDEASSRLAHRLIETDGIAPGDRVSVRGQQLVDDPLQHRAHQIRGGLSEQIIQIGCRVDRMRCSGHRHRPFGEMW